MFRSALRNLTPTIIGIIVIQHVQSPTTHATSVKLTKITDEVQLHSSQANWIILFLFFSAERKTSLGKDWHGACLRCEKCNKTLVPGSHAEHEGKPYCHNPCYSALYGPGGK